MPREICTYRYYTYVYVCFVSHVTIDLNNAQEARNSGAAAYQLGNTSFRMITEVKQR